MESSAWTQYVRRLFGRLTGTEIAPKTLHSVTYRCDSNPSLMVRATDADLLPRSHRSSSQNLHPREHRMPGDPEERGPRHEAPTGHAGIRSRRSERRHQARQGRLRLQHP
eukprot:2937418-Prymnesium_polylepis.1